MNHNRKRREMEARERRRREAALKERDAASIAGVLVDPTALAPSNSYSRPDFVERGYYVDHPFDCIYCGVEQVWTAAQQKWWYEVAKGDRHSGACLCRACRREARREKGMNRPLHDFGRWIVLMRSDLEPALLAAGWRPVLGEGEESPSVMGYQRGEVLVRFRREVISSLPALILERRDGPDAPFQTLAQADGELYATSQSERRRRYNVFRSAARRALGGVGASMAE